MIFAAGLGTRLRPLTERYPKPAVPFFGRPLAYGSMLHLERAGFGSLVANTHYLADRCASALHEALPEGATLTISHEPELLGTAGGIVRAVAVQSSALGPLAEDDVFVAVNGDISFFPDLDRVVARHREVDAFATMVVRESPDARSLGAIECDVEGRVRRVIGRSAPGFEAAPLRPFMFTGVHVFSRRAIEALPAIGCNVRQGYVPWVERGEHIEAVVDGGPFADLGTVHAYLETHLDVLRDPVRRAVFADRDRGTSGDAWIDRDAVVEGASIRESVVMAGAVVRPGVTLEAAIVWPHAVVERDVRRGIVLPPEEAGAVATIVGT